MKQALKYGFYLGVALILINVLYYFIQPVSLYAFFGKAMLFELLVYAVFMFFAISKNSSVIEDGGTFFKIAFLTLTIGLILSFAFRYTLSHILSEELNPIFLEAKQADEKYPSDFFGNDPLNTLERVELMEDSIEEDMTISNFMIMNGLGLLFLGIPFTILVTFLSRKFLNIRKKRFNQITNQNQNINQGQNKNAT